MIDSIRKYLEGFQKSVGEFFEGLWDKLLEWLNEFVDWILETIIWVGESVYWFFLDEKEGWTWWLLEIMLDAAEWFVEQLPDISGVLDRYASTFRTTMDLIGRVDDFFPVTEYVILFGVFIVFIILFLYVKMILKLIPTIG